MQPCRFVPKKTCSETSSATDGTKLDQNIGFQGLALLDSGPNLQPCGFSHISFMTTLATGHSKNWQQNVQYMWKPMPVETSNHVQPLNPTSGGPIGPISVTRSISFTLITWH